MTTVVGQEDFASREPSLTTGAATPFGAARHTPGPWHANPKADEEGFFEDVSVLRHDGLAVVVAVHNGDIPPDAVMANARLIAAAPDGLAANREALDFIQAHFGPVASDDAKGWSDDDARAVAEKLRAAINKAVSK